MAAPAELVIKVLADVSKAKSALGSMSTEGGKLGKFAQGTSTAILGVGVATGAFGLSAVKSAEEAAAGVAGLEQVFKSMGDSTGTAAADAQTYASELSKLTAIEDDTIIAAQTQLATFGAVSDETAQAAGIFDRATGAAADLAAAGFGSMDSNAVALGKALNDPIKGIGALAKSGVTFTDAEKEMIASMQEAGDMTGAQEVVLKALEKQVGGTAAATATGSEKMATALGETKESIGAALLPAFEKLTTVITEDLLPAIQPMIDLFSKNIDIILPLAGMLLAITAGLKLAAIAQAIMNSTLLASPVTWIILGLVALIAVIVLVIKNWDKIVAATKAAWATIKGALAAVWNWIKSSVVTVFSSISRFISGIWTGIKDAWSSVATWFGGLKDKVLGWFANAANWLLNAGKNVIGGLWTGYKDAWVNVLTWLGGLIDKVKGFFSGAAEWLFNIGKDIIKGLWDGLKDMWSDVTGWIGGLGDKIADLKGPPARDARLLVGAGKLIMGGLESGLASGWSGVASYLGSRNLAINGSITGGVAGRGGSSSTYQLNMYPRTANANDVAYGFRRLELARTGR